MTPRCALALLLAVMIACVAPLGAAQAGGAQIRLQDNVATAIDEQDATHVFDFAWELRKQRGGDIDHRNLAQAAARCTDCRATAIAFQVVLVHGSPGSVTPHNRAVAVTDHCTACVVYAGARQFVRVTEEPVVFTEAARGELADVRQDLRALEQRELGAAELQAAVEAQDARVLAVLETGLVPQADPSDGAEIAQEDDNQADDAG